MDSAEYAKSILSLGMLPVVLVAAVAAFGAFLILTAGVVSTLVGWIPQPTLGTLTTAFQFYLIFVVGSVLIRGGLYLFRLPSVLAAVVVLGIAAVIGGPFVYLLIHAATTVWEAVPDTYEVQASFLFLLSMLLGNLARTSDD